MTAGRPDKRRSRFIASALTASLVAFLSFALNVLYGKFALFFGWDAGLRLASVPEFWLLFASAAFFIVAALAAERQAGAYPPPARTNHEDSNDEKRQGTY
jgi:hypothetical protein